MNRSNIWSVDQSSPKMPTDKRRYPSPRFNPEPQFPVRPVYMLNSVQEQKVLKPYVQWSFYYLILGKRIFSSSFCLTPYPSVLAACGLFFQLNDIANLYFQYETVTVFEIESKF